MQESSTFAELAVDQRLGLQGLARDVEDALYGLDAVKEVAVVGVPEDYRGETVKSFVSLRPGASATGEGLIAFCKERMAAYEYPREITFLEEPRRRRPARSSGVT